MIKRKKMNKEELENQDKGNIANEENSSQPLKNDDSQQNTDLSEIEKIEQLGQKLEEMNEKFLRLYSDFENFRKRTAKEKIEMIKFASEDTIKDILPIVDDYERAIENLNNQEDVPETVKEGIQLIYNKFINLLTQKGVKPILAKGELFDENLHEAVSQFPAIDKSQKGYVADVLIKGYTMYDKVIRYSKVVVAI